MTKTTPLHPNKLAESILEIMPQSMRVIRKEVGSAKGELTVPQLRVLSHVHRGLRTANELAKQQSVSVVAISKMVQHLVKRGLLRRTQKPGNRKQIFLELTAKGLNTHMKVQKIALKNIARKIERRSASERADLRHGLAVLFRLFTAETKESR